MGKDLDYVVLADFSVHLIDCKEETDSPILFFIKSKFIKKSRGQQLYTYYENTFFDKDHNIIEDNRLEFDRFWCQLDKTEKWRTIKGNTSSVTIIVVVSDKLGNTLEVPNYDMTKIAKIRFDGIFEYLKLIDKYGTHDAAKKISELDKTNTK